MKFIDGYSLGSGQGGSGVELGVRVKKCLQLVNKENSMVLEGKGSFFVYSQKS